ncbi:MAG: DNA replication and repair protein RecF [Amoebophilaceae bacterium]|jgi:DNA replication and repair protein RecF|nr:DNA replication and repair protein RecF [Amoebophilaceae bacterium]
MLLRKLRCAHFKNHTAVELNFAAQLNFIVGPNGAGKTTLLDGIHYLSLTKSALNTVDTQNIQYGKEVFAVEGHFVKEEKPYAVKCTFQKYGGKCFQIDGKPYERLRDHIGLFPIVLTTPYDMDLIRGGSEGRRRFFDTLLCQLDRSYLNTLLQYQQLLKQRNSLLKLCKAAGQVDQDLLHFYEQRLLPLGQQLFSARSAFIKTFMPSFQKHYRYFVAASEEVQLVYASEVASPDFEQKFRHSLPQDLALQRTTQGVHRDEVHFLLNGHPLKKRGSQGQQKSFVIALRLAQFECMHQFMKLKPILLLDDIFDKLDEQRMDRLVQLMIQQHFGQVFITDAKGKESAAIMQRVKADQALIHMDQGRHVVSGQTL